VVSLYASSTNNLTTEYSYDVADRLIGLTAKEREKTQNFVYGYSSENGRISSVTNLESGLVTSYAYDLMDRATNISYRTSTGSLIRSLDYKFDAVGMIKNIFTSDDSSQLSVKSYRYDSIDRLVSETHSTSNLPPSTTHYSYDLAGTHTSKVSNGWKTDYSIFGSWQVFRRCSVETRRRSNLLQGSRNSRNAVETANRRLE